MATWRHRREHRGEVRLHAPAAGRVLGRVHKRAARAIDAGYFKSQIIAVELKTKKGVDQFTTDEHVRRDATMEGMGS